VEGAKRPPRFGIGGGENGRSERARGGDETPDPKCRSVNSYFDSYFMPSTDGEMTGEEEMSGPGIGGSEGVRKQGLVRSGGGVRKGCEEMRWKKDERKRKGECLERQNVAVIEVRSAAACTAAMCRVSVHLFPVTHMVRHMVTANRKEVIELGTFRKINSPSHLCLSESSQDAFWRSVSAISQ